MSNAKDNFRKVDDVRQHWSTATWTAKGRPEAERGGIQQFGVPAKDPAYIAWGQFFIQHLVLEGNTSGRQTLN